MESPNPKHQGELSLLEMIQSMRSPSGSSDADQSSARFAIELDDERHRRQECEKVIKQLQSQISALQQDNAVGEAAIQRKDSLLLQAQQQWKLCDNNWKEKLRLNENEKEQLASKLAKSEVKQQSIVEEKDKAIFELKNVILQNDHLICNLKNENQKLKEMGEQHQLHIKELTLNSEESDNKTKRAEKKLDDMKREYNRLKSQMEDLKREKGNSEVELELLQERYESSRQQWEAHCHTRVQETIQTAEQEAERRLKVWQTEVEGKLRHLVSTLEQQLGILKEKSVEESNKMAAQHETEVNGLRERCVTLQKQVQKQQRDYEDLTQQMRQLVEAQWNTVNRFHPTQGANYQQPPTGYCDATSQLSTGSSVKTTSSFTKRDEIQQYVNQVIERHNVNRVQTNPPLRKKS